MNRLFILFSLLAFTLVACKKKNNNVNTTAKTTISPTWNLNKTWNIWGISTRRLTPSGGVGSYSSDTITHSRSITVLNDSTVYLLSTYWQISHNPDFDTLAIFDTDSAQEYIEYVPKVWIEIGSRHSPTNLKYYYSKDSITYYYQNGGVSFTDSIWWTSK